MILPGIFVGGTSFETISLRAICFLIANFLLCFSSMLFIGGGAKSLNSAEATVNVLFSIPSNITLKSSST